MPTASEQLRALWEDDADALRYLAKQGIREVKNGVLVAPNKIDDWSRISWSAAYYLCDEWDFCIVGADDPILGEKK